MTYTVSTVKQTCGTILSRWGWVIIMSLLAGLIYNYFFLSRAYVEFEYSIDHNSTIMMIWAGENERYDGSNMGRERLVPGKTKCGFFLDDLRKIRHIRLDPMGRRAGEVTIRQITITQPGMTPLVFADEDDFSRFQIGSDIAKLSFAEGKGWTVTSKGGNPNLHLLLDPPGERSLNIPVQGGIFLILLLSLFLLLRSVAPYVQDFNYVSLLAFAVVLLVQVMALTTLNDHHPDESVHARAAAYYEDHWLMPAVDSPEIADTFSCYGFSRLNSTEICYFLTGKFTRLFDNFHLPSYQCYRMFNVLLLSALVLLTFQSLTARLIFIPFLMTPQAWYLFSYYNSDAFALFTAFLAAYQVTCDKSLFNRFLAGRETLWKAVPLLGLLVAALLLTKKNFYFFVIFLVLYIVSKFIFKRYQRTLPVVKKLIIIICAGAAIFGVRYGADISVNGFDKGAKVQQVREQKADYMYKPSTSLNEKHPYLYLRARGVGFRKYLEKYRWGGKAVRSFYGVYGYMTVSGTTAYYDLMRITGFLFLGFITITILWKGGWWENTMLCNAAVCGLTLIGLACYRSWVSDLQAQGRYLLVVLPILGMLIAHTRQLFQPLIMRSFVVFMFIMSLHNFTFIGLFNLAKFGWG